MIRHKNCGCGKCIPPEKQHVEIYFLQKGISLHKAQEFYREFEQRAWRNNQGNVISNWKVHAWEWAWAHRRAD